MITYEARYDEGHGIYVGYARPSRKEFLIHTSGFGSLERAKEFAEALNRNQLEIQSKLELDHNSETGTRKLANWYNEKDAT